MAENLDYVLRIQVQDIVAVTFVLFNTIFVNLTDEMREGVSLLDNTPCEDNYLKGCLRTLHVDAPSHSISR